MTTNAARQRQQRQTRRNLDRLGKVLDYALLRVIVIEAAALVILWGMG